MNILVFNGSPKGESSNTMQLVRAFLNGAGWSNAEIVNVAGTNVKPCVGCFSCWNKTPGKCVLRDNMGELLEKIIAADIIIWAFPLYYFSIPGALKNIIDRQLPLNLPFMSSNFESGSHIPRYDLSHKRYAVISTCGFWTAKGNYDAVTAMFDHHYGAGRYASIFCGQGELFRIPELKNRTNAYLETAQRAGVEFAAGSISANTSAELAMPLFQRDVFEKMADASWGISETGIPETDDSLNFTNQMASLYIPDGASRVLEFCYTDLDKTYQVLLTAEGSAVITEGFKPYTTKIETPYSVWRGIARGDISGHEALFQRKYKVTGDFDVMLKWDNLFGVSVPKSSADEDRRCKTNMTVLLAPWIIIWTAFAINAKVGGAVGVIAAAALPFAWLFFKSVIFEQVSVFAVASLSLAILLGADTQIVIPASYGFFGLMWLISAFTKTPLTAYYSANSYGGEKALINQLFIQTNRILTTMWGVLYIATSIWTYWMMGTNAAKFTGLINSACPALMGIFTMWFQKWYPAQWARK